MTKDDRAVFGRHLIALAETFAEPMSSARLYGYFAALTELPLPAVLRAIETALSTARFFPRPAELRELAGVGAPDAGLIETLLVSHLRQAAGEQRLPGDAFLRLLIDRLGGLRQVADMPSGVRISALRSILPSAITAARMRGLALPCEAMDARPVERRSLDTQPSAPIPESGVCSTVPTFFRGADDERPGLPRDDAGTDD
ncbi:MAG TPA: hypothetical protein VMS22_23360 [Candidatus Eisenbacteria bacterium]|nr:hypothetical protein [Candidatus Eisenbacteria bacterium]